MQLERSDGSVPVNPCELSELHSNIDSVFISKHKNEHDHVIQTGHDTRQCPTSACLHVDNVTDATKSLTSDASVSSVASVA